MTSLQTQTIVLDTLTTYGLATLAILGAVLTVSVAYLVFRFGWERLANDRSLKIFGIYVRDTPYKGYNRFRSQKWNLKNTM